MSFQLNAERGKKSEIEMPPLPQETEAAHDTTTSSLEDQPDQIDDLQADSSTEQPEPQQQEVAPQPQQETHQAKNFRQLKEQKEAIQRERDEYMMRLREYEKALAQQAQQQEDNEDLTVNVNSDDLVEGKHLNKYEKRIKKLEAQLNNYQSQTQHQIMQTKLRTQYPDFEKVVTEDNIIRLQENHPELAATLNNGTDLYNVGSAAYKLIKQFGIYVEDNYGKDREKIAQNMQKPRSAASLSPQQGASPLSRANAFAEGLTDDLKAQLHKEMLAAMKSR